MARRGRAVVVHWRAERNGLTWFLLHGALGGVLGGVVSISAEMLWAVAIGDPASAPLRLIAATVLGEEALAPAYPLETAAFVAFLAHFAYAMTAGAVIGAVLHPLARSLPGVVGTWWGMVLAGTFMGFLLWPLSFYIVAPLLGWTWLAERTEPVPQALFHALFGLTLGGYLAIVGSRRVEVRAR